MGMGGCADEGGLLEGGEAKGRSMLVRARRRWTRFSPIAFQERKTTNNQRQKTGTEARSRVES